MGRIFIWNPPALERRFPRKRRCRQGFATVSPWRRATVAKRRGGGDGRENAWLEVLPVFRLWRPLVSSNTHGGEAASSDKRG